MKLLAALTLGLVLLVPLDLHASVIECRIASVQGRDGPDGREFILTFQIPADMSGAGIEAGFLQFEGSFSDGIGVSAEVMSSPIASAGALDTEVLVDGVRSGTIAVAESVDGALECGFKGTAFSLAIGGQSIAVLIRPLSQSRRATTGLESHFSSCRLVVLVYDRTHVISSE